jgi:hypothetical protein
VSVDKKLNDSELEPITKLEGVETVRYISI